MDIIVTLFRINLANKITSDYLTVQIECMPRVFRL